MANVLDRYGIKEVADVTFFELNADESKGDPVLFLDTLKVSTIEQTAEEATANGGKGNAPLIVWDYGKEITVTLEDALFSPKSLAIMFGDADGILSETNADVYKTVRPSAIADGKVTINGVTTTASEVKYYAPDGTETENADEAEFAVVKIQAKNHITIDVSANSFPGNYYVTGDTYARSEATGKDEFFQFVIPKAKVQSENTITMEADGDPSVFNMSLKVLRPKDGVMMKLIKYTV
jgi:hypothetical protein